MAETRGSGGRRKREHRKRAKRHTLSHDLLVVDRVPDVDVRVVRRAGHRRVEVEDVRRRALSVEVRVEPLDEGGLAGAGHADGDNHCRLVRRIFGGGGGRGGGSAGSVGSRGGRGGGRCATGGHDEQEKDQSRCKEIDCHE
jgi:hypothetical protein